MNIKLNGELKDVDENSSLDELIQYYLNGKEPKGIAAALNDNIVPKAKWAATQLNENDLVEIVHAVQGG
jgi:sulfur carrier protein